MTRYEQKSRNKKRYFFNVIHFHRFLEI